MRLIEDKDELKQKFLEVVEYLVMHGEMMKGLWYLQNPPSYIDEELEISNRLGEVLSRLNELKSLQNQGTVNGRFNAGFTIPENIEKIVAFQLLKKHIERKGLKKLIDVGCFSGWMGKELSVIGEVKLLHIRSFRRQRKQYPGKDKEIDRIEENEQKHGQFPDLVVPQRIKPPPLLYVEEEHENDP